MIARLSLLIALVIGGSLVRASPAAACSAGPDFDTAVATQLLVRGKIRAVEIGAVSMGDFREATVTLDVAWTYRGERYAQVRYVDRASVAVLKDPRTGRDTVFYAGGSGACGTIDFDPVGKHALIALARGEDGRWYANRLYGAIYLDAADHGAYRWLLERHGVRVPFLAFTSEALVPWAALVP